MGPPAPGAFASQRAAALFQVLTLGAYTQLHPSEERGRQVMVARRANGEAVGVGGMSTGTRDQLYLALRLAYLEDFARHNEPAPFIGDDIFQTFDDQRTQAGLRVLAATSGSVQPILFTHHRSVVDAGLHALGTDLDLIEW